LQAFRRLYEEVGLGWFYAVTKYEPVSAHFHIVNPRISLFQSFERVTVQLHSFYGMEHLYIKLKETVESNCYGEINLKFQMLILLVIPSSILL
jgi:hypothetical protein